MNAYPQAIRRLPLRRISKLVIYFVSATVVGWYLEIIWTYLRFHLYDPGFIITQLAKPPLAEPYGLGAVALIVIVIPMLQRYKLGLAATWALNTLVTAAVEYISAVALVIIFGHNTFWNYSIEPFNLNGYISLETSLFFGIVATLFVYFAYPACERLLAHMSRKQIGVVTLVLGTLYIVALVLFKRW